MALSHWLAFFLTTLVVALSPGPGAVLSMSTGLRDGVRAALMAIAGLQTALLVQLGLVALGMGAVLAASDTAFMVIKFAGAAYLILLGLRAWRDTGPPNVADRGGAQRGSHYRQGILVNLGNPKAILFIAALVPQFVDPAQPRPPQFMIMALTLCTVDTVVMSGYAMLAARCRAWMTDARAVRTRNRFFGTLFVVAGMALALATRA
ncbi:MAG TPA: LysE family transporter [Zoogloea sp.]|uniref:LysE family transporter n=1 Tax=Zoogloea sp. TaxID=49181 RepID=UPI002CD402A9|nr:LysE family transporter [Zoogloea sp.]HMV16940.1 LysE family transporter [Rhodocyclaceae bacterium]HMW53083.1 LysE family transporter [Rhodocyclaceae bacterium]HNA67295.1 LysE family transporter [Rhodocyclaceae bacterium]HNB66054.1 LysE family transporter [Rhodocyclaceae bacterium]HND25519.1 LysE family transporter [Rhodocyclaceae bacterium]